ncbi:hypothetical protein [Undibacterium sp. TC9W]|uniref:hypothetical protein n=1 Tax=Undibacterium sp. TC9W TaxID=3413053 RepID=UPI003BF2866E
MGIELIIERRGRLTAPISIEEWLQFVATQADLRFRTEAHIAVNPVDASKVNVFAGGGEVEILVKDRWLPFFRHNRGKLRTKYQESFEDPLNEIRIKIIFVAKAMNSVIRTDADDEILNWESL